MNNDDLDPRYPDFRAHAALQERVSKLEASLMHLPNDVAELRRRQDQIFAKLDVIGEKMDAFKAIAPVDHGALALQRMLDVVERRGGQPGPSWVERAIALIGAMAIGAIAFKIAGIGA